MEPVKEMLSFTVTPENTNDLRFINPLVICIILSLFVDLNKKLKPIKKPANRQTQNVKVLYCVILVNSNSLGIFYCQDFLFLQIYLKKNQTKISSTRYILLN